MFIILSKIKKKKFEYFTKIIFLNFKIKKTKKKKQKKKYLKVIFQKLKNLFLIF